MFTLANAALFEGVPEERVSERIDRGRLAAEQTDSKGAISAVAPER